MSKVIHLIVPVRLRHYDLIANVIFVCPVLASITQMTNPQSVAVGSAGVRPQPLRRRTDQCFEY